MLKHNIKLQLKLFVSDNAKELYKGDAQRFFLSKEILYQKSCTHAAQQNGVVEHKHGHLLETAWSLQVKSNLPKCWVNVFNVLHILYIECP